MAKFILIKIGLMAEITDADALRETALEHFDDADTTSDDHPDTSVRRRLSSGTERLSC